jgi:hypothetical protein
MMTLQLSGVIMVLGTLLPLCLNGAIATTAGGVVIAGLVVCCAGLAFSVQSLQLRDREEREDRQIRRRAEQADKLAVEDSCPKPETEILPSTAADVGDVEKSTEQEDDSDGPSTLYKVALCVTAGIFASSLQFAFVFGNSLMDLATSAEGPGSTPSSGTSAVIWLFAISLGTPPSILFGLYNKAPDIPLSRIYQCPWYRHFWILLTTAAPWVAHIHLYGYANTQLPEDLAAGVAWPVLMMTTVVAGMLWSIALGEWSLASTPVKLKLYQGLGLVSAGVIVIMVSVAI